MLHQPWYCLPHALSTPSGLMMLQEVLVMAEAGLNYYFELFVMMIINLIGQLKPLTNSLGLLITSTYTGSMQAHRPLAAHHTCSHY